MIAAFTLASNVGPSAVASTTAKMAAPKQQLGRVPTKRAHVSSSILMSYHGRRYNRAVRLWHTMIPCYSHHTAIYAHITRMIDAFWGRCTKVKDGE